MDNNNGRGHILVLTTTAAAIFNLGAIVIMCFIVIPLMLSLGSKIDSMEKGVDNFNKTAKRLNDAMDANEARIKAAKK